MMSMTAPSISIDVSDRLTEEARALITRTQWGTSGALYTVKDYPESLKPIPGLRYLHLRKAGRLIGFRILALKMIRVRTRHIPALYHSLFIVDPSERGNGYGRRLANATLDFAKRQLEARGLVYAFTEAGNVSSSKIKAAQGYQPIGRFYTTAFSRLFPAHSIQMATLRPSHRGQIVDCLTQQYSGHSLGDFETSVLPEHYYVLYDAGGIVAGVQAEPQRWTIQALEGISGRIALHALPHIPLLRTLFNPHSFEFLRIGNIYFQPGRADAAHQLIESVLAVHERKTAIAFLDKQSPTYMALAKAGSFGLLNALTETAVDVTGYFMNLSPDEITELQRSPLAISPFDI